MIVKEGLVIEMNNEESPKLTEVSGALRILSFVSSLSSARTENEDKMHLLFNTDLKLNFGYFSASALNEIKG